MTTDYQPYSLTSLQRIVNQFQLAGSASEIRLFGNGHIHDTYKVQTVSSEHPNYLLQRVNSTVFPKVDQMMENIHRVTAFYSSNLNKQGKLDTSREVLQVISTVQNRPFLLEGQTYWRLFRFVDNAHSYESPQNLEQAFEAGRSLGKFQRMLSDFPAETLYETIPHFHDVKKRIRKFNRVLKNPVPGRMALAEEEIQVVNRRKREMGIFTDLLREGFLPVRVTHNDTKFNNLLFDEKGKALMWIDLDTVMPGCIHFDFGDALRTLANEGQEDEKDLQQIGFNLERYKAFTRGYLEEMGGVLTPIELIHLAFSPKMMTFIMGLRFLTDFLEGDVYYKTSFPDHNLIRSKAQFHLLSKMDEVDEEMKAFVEHCLLDPL